MAIEIDPDSVFQHPEGWQSGVDPAADSASDGADGGLDAVALSKTLARVALAAALVGVALLAWVWYSWQKESDREPDQPELPPAFAPPAGASVAAADGPPWRPERIELGRTFTAHYRSGEGTRFYQTWLVYDSEGSLLGGAGLQSQVIANVNLLELWFFERAAEGEEGGSPVLTIVSRAAYDDKLFRARLGNRELMPAVPGQRAVLSTAALELEAVIDAVSPEAGSADLGLESVAISLMPARAPAPDDRETAAPEQP
jgi:hypothetical protein